MTPRRNLKRFKGGRKASIGFSGNPNPWVTAGPSGAFVAQNASATSHPACRINFGAAGTRPTWKRPWRTGHLLLLSCWDSPSSQHRATTIPSSCHPPSRKSIKLRVAPECRPLPLPTDALCTDLCRRRRPLGGSGSISAASPLSSRIIRTPYPRSGVHCVTTERRDHGRHQEEDGGQRG